MVTSDFFFSFLEISWPVFLKKSEITHRKGILIRKIMKIQKKLQQQFLCFFFPRVDLMWNNSKTDFLTNFCIFQPNSNQNMFWKHNFINYAFYLLDDFNFQNGGNIQDGVFQIFYDFLQALEFLIYCELLNLLF
jgi:hypothetical protein